jgi:hypothetical protein
MTLDNKVNRTTSVSRQRALVQDFSCGTHVVHRKQLQHAGTCRIASDAPAPPLLITSHELPHSPANERPRNCRLAGENGRLPQQLLDGGSPWTWTPGDGKYGAGCVGKDFAKNLLIPLSQLVLTHGRRFGAVCKKLSNTSKKEKRRRREEKGCCPAFRKTLNPAFYVVCA